MESNHDSHEFDVGEIIDGVILYDDQLNKYIIMDDEGTKFDIQSAFEKLNGKKVRLTLISFDSMDKIEDFLKSINN